MGKPIDCICDSVYTKRNHIKRLLCDSVLCNLNHTLSTGSEQIRNKNGEARRCDNTNGPLTTSDNQRIEVAMSDHTTHPQGRDSLPRNKFTWRFLALSRTDRKAKPCRLSVVAHSEREARQVLASHFILSLAARLPATVEEISMEVPHVA
ncbi:host cell division inhibitor Icd-like protein [Serratia proteamaculans]|uniref:host cell division inhibitor Icd-like protein n=3 Tax=Serratia TaxID=613 RepID=UPI0039B08C50